MIVPQTPTSRLREYKEAHTRAYDIISAALERERKAGRTRQRLYRMLLKIDSALGVSLDFNEMSESLAKAFKQNYNDKGFPIVSRSPPY